MSRWLAVLSLLAVPNAPAQEAKPDAEGVEFFEKKIRPLFTERCHECHGDGRISATETVSVKVPAGVATGNFIPLRGLGDAGPRGGPAGDLIAVIEEKPHAVFERSGSDLRIDLPVSIATAALGGTVELPALDGRPASVTIPAGAGTGQTVRVRGRGLPSLRGGTGDLVARIVVWAPTRLTPQERRTLEELGRSENFRPPR